MTRINQALAAALIVATLVLGATLLAPANKTFAQGSPGDHQHYYYAWCYNPPGAGIGLVMYRVVWHNWFHWKLSEYYWLSSDACWTV